MSLFRLVYFKKKLFFSPIGLKIYPSSSSVYAYSNSGSSGALGRSVNLLCCGGSENEPGVKKKKSTAG